MTREPISLAFFWSLSSLSTASQNAHAMTDTNLPLLVQQMLKPEFYPHPVTATIDLIQTHVSYVLLTGEFVYKLKKPVNYGFLDFSTLEKRKHFCHEELRLNQRGAAELYLAVFLGRRGGDDRVCCQNGAVSPGDAVERNVRSRRTQGVSFRRSGARVG
jgi:aminoglycoside phosphotransferase family enzyme